MSADDVILCGQTEIAQFRIRTRGTMVDFAFCAGAPVFDEMLLTPAEARMVIRALTIAAAEAEDGES